MKLIFKIHKWLINLHPVWFVTTVLTIMWLLTFLLAGVIQFFPENISNETNPGLYMNLAAIFMAPPLETLLFQFIPIYIFKEFTKLQNWLIILISSILFSLTHFTSIVTIISSFLMGLILAYSFIVYMPKKQSAYWITTRIHFLKNLPLSIYFLFYA